MRYLIGLGNYAMGDDGIGLRVVEYISEAGLDTGFKVVEAGNDGILVLTYFTEDTERLVIVDAADFGGKPGEVTTFSPEDVNSCKQVGTVSTHEGDVLKLFEMARRVGLPVPRTDIIAIQPARMKPDQGLSPELERRFEEYVRAALTCLGEA